MFLSLTVKIRKRDMFLNIQNLHPKFPTFPILMDACDFICVYFLKMSPSFVHQCGHSIVEAHQIGQAQSASGEAVLAALDWALPKCLPQIKNCVGFYTCTEFLSSK